jgi:hypothetical protein
VSAPSVSLNAGDILAGKYRILRLLGRGGMGAVFAAEHTLLGHEVAIKLLLDDSARTASLVQRFINEAGAASRIHGEHVVRVFDVDRLPDGNLFIAMELLQGEDLDNLVEREGTLQPVVAVDYILQATSRASSRRTLRLENQWASAGSSATATAIAAGLARCARAGRTPASRTPPSSRAPSTRRECALRRTRTLAS